MDCTSWSQISTVFVPSRYQEVDEHCESLRNKHSNLSIFLRIVAYSSQHPSSWDSLVYSLHTHGNDKLKDLEKLFLLVNVRLVIREVQAWKH